MGILKMNIDVITSYEQINASIRPVQGATVCFPWQPFSFPECWLGKNYFLAGFSLTVDLILLSGTFLVVGTFFSPHAPLLSSGGKRERQILDLMWPAGGLVLCLIRKETTISPFRNWASSIIIP